MSDDKKLNLPAIRRGGKLRAPAQQKKIKPIDLEKNAAISRVLDSNKTVQEDVTRREQGLDLVLVGDLTGSMRSYHQLLKEQFSSLYGTLFPMIQNLKIGIVFYLDHCPGYVEPYVTRVQPLTSDQQLLQKFIDETHTGHGGDEEEALEDAFHDVNNMNWRQISSRSVVLFGDAGPHEPNECPNQHSYFDLVKEMEKQSIVINSVFCRPGYSDTALQKLEDVDVGDFSKRITSIPAPNFFSWVANVTGGMIIGIEQISDLIEIIKASAAKDSGSLDKYEETLKLREPSKLKLIPIAKKAEERRKIAIDRKAKLLGHKKEK